MNEKVSISSTIKMGQHRKPEKRFTIGPKGQFLQ
jgi:hypothetical protein